MGEVFISIVLLSKNMERDQVHWYGINVFCTQEGHEFEGTRVGMLWSE